MWIQRETDKVFRTLIHNSKYRFPYKCNDGVIEFHCDDMFCGIKDEVLKYTQVNVRTLRV